MTWANTPELAALRQEMLQGASQLQKNVLWIRLTDMGSFMTRIVDSVRKEDRETYMGEGQPKDEPEKEDGGFWE